LYDKARKETSLTEFVISSAFRNLCEESNKYVSLAQEIEDNKRVEKNIIFCALV